MRIPKVYDHPAHAIESGAAWDTIRRIHGAPKLKTQPLPVGVDGGGQDGHDAVAKQLIRLRGPEVKGPKLVTGS